MLGVPDAKLAFQNLAFMINGTPRVMRHSINLHKNLIQMPLPVRTCAHPADPVSPDLSSKHRAKSIPPVPHRFVTDVDASLVQQVLDVSERKWKANVHHDRQANDLRAAVKVLEGVFFHHMQKLRNRPARLKSNPSDKTLDLAFRVVDIANSADGFDDHRFLRVGLDFSP